MYVVIGIFLHVMIFYQTQKSEKQKTNIYLTDDECGVKFIALFQTVRMTLSSGISECRDAGRCD